MKRMSKKDPYSILGVDRSATQEQIREAYVDRVRVIHPDRFDRQQQPRDWAKANEMLSELNEAYAVLRDSPAKAEYDRPKKDRVASPGPKPNIDESRSWSLPSDAKVSTGAVKYSDLPEEVQERLLERQENRIEDQIRIKTASIRRNFVFAFAPLLWFLYLFSSVGGVLWEGEMLFLYALCTIAAGLIMGRNLVVIVKWNESTLKSFFYVTPLYFIKTELDIVSFRPIWTVRDIAVTHNLRHGSYRNSDILFKFEGHNESVRVSSKSDAEEILNRVDAYNAALRREVEQRNYGYLKEHNDFFRVRGFDRLVFDVPFHPGKQAALYGASLLVCLGGLWIAATVNGDPSWWRWGRQPGLPVHSPEAPGSVAGPVATPKEPSRPSVPRQPLPVSGSVRRYTDDEPVAPFQVKADEGSHYLLKLVDVRDGSRVLVVFVRSGTMVEIKVPVGAFEARYASGETWYGYDYLFGPDTVYSKVEETLDFQVTGDRARGYEMTLHKVPSPTLGTRAIEARGF
jgi:hypothetical protein